MTNRQRFAMQIFLAHLEFAMNAKLQGIAEQRALDILELAEEVWLA